MFELNNISWIYPINFNKHAMHIFVSMSEIVNEVVEILPVE